MDNEQPSIRAQMTPSMFQNEQDKKVLRHKKEKKMQAYQKRLGRDPYDTTGQDYDWWSILCQKDQGKEYFPGVSNRKSMHILTVTDNEIKEGTLKSKAFIDRYYRAYDDTSKLYSIWTLIDDLKDYESLHPGAITVEELEQTNRYFSQHAKQIKDQLSLDASERHSREARRRKNIEFIGMCLSAFTALSGAVTGFMNNGSKQSIQRLEELGYSQILIGLVVASIIKMISSFVEEHAKAARNLDVTLTWADSEINRLKKELIDFQGPYLERIRSKQVVNDVALLPVAQRLQAMRYTWLQFNSSAPEKSLFESFSCLQHTLFGIQETAASIEQAVFDFTSRNNGRRIGLFVRASDVPVTANLEALAKIYEVTIVLVSEILLSDNTHYVIVNEPLIQPIDAAGEEKEVGDTVEGGLELSIDAPTQPEKPMRYMVLYRLSDNQYQPVLAPLNLEWNELKTGLESLPSSLDVTASASEDTLPSLTHLPSPG